MLQIKRNVCKYRTHAWKKKNTGPKAKIVARENDIMN